ncbi:MAG: hypothetical protein K2H13_07535 [Eubacterium sp.]|nr:hypothetical protein [Eubacterium sp.]MDE6767933.1 hypothetical protein [Eubacterium sp.]
MKFNLTVRDVDLLFDRVEKSKMFTSKKSVSGLSVRYNDVFTIIGNPKINLIKISDTEIKADILPSILLVLICVVSTLFFLAIAVYAIVTSKLNIPVIIFVFLLPSLIWILQHVFNKEIAKQVREELEKEDRKI